MQEFIQSPQTHYKVLKQLGKGASGSVYLCQDTHDNKYYAIKKVSSQFKDEKEIALFLVKNFKDAQYVVKFYEVFETPTNTYYFYIRMEYCNQDSLYDDIYKENSKFKDEDVTSTALQIARGIKELHNFNIIHRDIKPENIISNFKETSRVMSYGTKQYKICDLGISKYNTLSASTQFIGTPYYIAPEMIQSNFGPNPYDGKVDVWALGCVIYEMITSKTLFEGTSMQELQQKIRDTKTDQKIKQRISDIPSKQFINLLNQMIEPQAENRSDIDKVISDLEQIENNSKKIRILKVEKINHQSNQEQQSQMPKQNFSIQSNTKDQQERNQIPQYQFQQNLINQEQSIKDQIEKNQIPQSLIVQNSNNVIHQKIQPEVQQLSQDLIDSGFLKIYRSTYFKIQFCQQKKQNIAPKTNFQNFEQIVHAELNKVANQ